MPLSRDESKRKKQLANLEKGKFKKGGVGNPKGRPPKPKTCLLYTSDAADE